MIVGTVRADEVNPQSFGDFFRFDIEVVEYFDVIADKTYGRYDDVMTSFGGELTQCVVDVGFEPGIGGIAAAALVSQ